MPSPRHPPVRRLSVAAALCCLAAFVAAESPEPAGSAGSAARTVADARRLEGEFTRADDGPRRREIAEELLSMGIDGGRRLNAACRRELREAWPRYTNGFQRAATALLKDRFAQDDPTAEIESLRRTIRDVAAADDLTKQMIQQRSDPALARLEEMLVVSPADVLAAHRELAVDREYVLALADWAERSAVLLSEQERRRLPALPGSVETAAQLDAADALAAMLALPLSPADRQTLSANVGLARDLEPEEGRGIQRLNQIRILAGLPVVAIDPALVQACRTHSEDMCTKGFFGHDSPVAGRENPWRRAKAAGTSARAENIAVGTKTGAGAIGMWWHSPGHHRNMLGDHKRTGLGRYEKHWTQLFG